MKKMYRSAVVIEIPMHCMQCYARFNWMHDYIWDSFYAWSYGYVGACAILGADPGPLRQEKILSLSEILAEYADNLKKFHPHCRGIDSAGPV